jgi:hypothetical protein
LENSFCKNCAHFHQHYGLDQKKIFRVFCGHCTADPKIRKRQPDSLACDRFVPAPSKESAFATKEYLSKALVEYMIQLELLQPISDAQESSRP